MILDEFFKPKSTAVLAEDNLQGTRPDDEEVKFFIDSEPAYYAVMDRFGDHIEFRGDDLVAPLRLWGAIQQTAGDAGGAADIAGFEDDRMGTDDELDEQGVTENYPKHQDLSGISTDKLKAYVAKYTSHPMSGEGAQVRRVRAELERRMKGVAEGSTTRGGFGGSAGQAQHEIEWLKKKISSLPPTKEKQIRDLQRQIRERELAIAFQKEGVAEGSGLGYNVIVRGNNFSYRGLQDALTDGHPNQAKVYKNGKLLGTIGSLSQQQDVAEGLMGSHFVRRGDPEAYLEKMRKIHKTLVKGGYKPLGYVSSRALSKPYQSAHYVHSTNPDTHPDVSVDRIGNQGHILVSMKKSKPVNLPEQGMAEGTVIDIDNKYRGLARKMVQIYKTVPKVKAAVDDSPEFYRAMIYVTGVITDPDRIDGTTHYDKIVDELESILSSDGEPGVAEGAMDDKIAKHNAAVAKMTKRTFAKLDYSHPDLLKKAPKGYAFGITHKLSPYEKDVSEAYNFKGSFPFDVDHMGGTRGINLPSAPTKKFFTDKKQWSQTVDDINSSKYDDNSEYSGTTGRTTVSIDNREWARWSDAQEKGYIEMSSMTEQDMAEGHGNYAGDRPVNLGGVSMKKIQIGDTVRYIDQKAQVVDMSRDRVHARITIPSSATTKTVLTSDLRQLGRGMEEGHANNGTDNTPVKLGKVEKLKTGIRHHADQSRYGGTIPDVEDHLLSADRRHKLHKAVTPDHQDTDELNELSPATLARYKTKAGAAATAADSAGDRKTGDRRFSGIVKATKKQFDQDAKQSAQAVHESRLRLMASIIKTQ